MNEKLRFFLNTHNEDCEFWFYTPHIVCAFPERGEFPSREQDPIVTRFRESPLTPNP